MFKNVATKIALFAFDTTTGAAKTGDAANLTAYVSKDYGAVTVLADTTATEMDATNAKGWYLFDVAQAETNADALLFTGKSSTANISIVGQYIHTTPNRFSSLVIDSAGLADVTAVKVGPSGAATAQTAGDILARLPSALVSGRMDASVGAMAADTLTSSALAASAVTEIQTGLSTLDAAGVRTAVGLASANLDTQLTAIDDYIDTEMAAVKAVTDKIDTAMELDGAVYRFTTNALEQAPSGTGASAVAIADEVQTRTIAGVTVVNGLAANTITAAALATDAVTEIQSGLATSAALSTVAGYVDTEVAAILAAVDTEVAAIKAKTDNLPAIPAAVSDIPTAAAVADAVWDEAISGHLTAGTTGAALNAAGSAGDPWSTPLPGAYGAGTAGKIIGDNINATISSRASQSSLDTVAGYVDTEVAAIKAKTDALPASPAATGDIPSAASIADAVWDEATSGHTSDGTSGAALRDADLRGSRTVIRGTVASGASTTQFTPSALDIACASTDQLKGRIIIFDRDTTTAALRGEATDITASSNASLPLLTFSALSATPAASDTFSIV